MSAKALVWLALKQNVPVPYGPTRNLAQMTDRNLSHYQSSPDPDGTMLDGNPFTIGWIDGAGVPGERLLTPNDTSVTILDRTLQFTWLPGVTDPGMLLLVHGTLNIGDGAAGSYPHGESTYEGYAYCLGWNSMCVSAGGQLSKELCRRFGLPDDMGYVPIVKPAPVPESEGE